MVVRQHQHQHLATRDHIHIAPDTRPARTCYQASTATSKHISHHKINQVNNALSMSGLNRRIRTRSKDVYMKRSKMYFIFPNATITPPFQSPQLPQPLLFSADPVPIFLPYEYISKDKSSSNYGYLYLPIRQQSRPSFRPSVFCAHFDVHTFYDPMIR